MAKIPARFNPMKWMRASSGSTIAEKIDQEERKFTAEQKKRNKDRITPIDRSKLVAELANNNRSASSGINIDDYVNKLFRDSSAESIDNRRIRTMVPEIAQASAFMVSAIISPNDLRQGEISIKNDETSLSTSQKAMLEEYLKEYFEERFKLSVSLPRWIDEALYGSGAKCLLTIPMSTLEKQILGNGISNESLNKLNASLESAGSLFGISSDESYDSSKLALETLSIATESLHTLRADKVPGKPRSAPRKEWEALVKDITDKKNFHLFDNPFLLRNEILQNEIATEALQGKLAHLTSIDARSKSKKNINKTVIDKINRKLAKNPNARIADSHKAPKDDDIQSFVQLTHTENDHTGEPLFMEVPSESIIPIFVPGNVSEALGYLAIIDENGHFASVSGDMSKRQGPNRYNSHDRSNINQLYQAGGYNVNGGAQRSSDAQHVMATLYQSIVGGYLDEKVRGAGYKNFRLGDNPSVYKYMFTQYMCNKQTRMLYIPADMLTYFTFEHGPDGRGVSDLEKAKYILSLKMCLQTSTIISQLNAAVDRKRITLTTDDTNSGNILQQMESITREYIQKNRWSMTSDPRQTANEILEKGITVNVKGMNGFDCDISEENNEKTAPTFDSELRDGIDKQVLMTMFVPPAAMNATSEDEYAKSVVTTNLFTSNVVLRRQRTVVHYCSEVLRNFTRYSPSLRQGILDIITATEGDEEKKTENGNIDPTRLTEDDKERLNNVIDSISIALPPPNIAPDRANYEVITEMARASDEIINALHPTELMGQENPSLVAAFEAYKAYAKSRYVQDMVDGNSLDIGHIYGLDRFDVNDITDLRQQVSNLSKGMMRQVQAMKIDEDNEKVKEAGGGGGFGGGFGGGSDFGGGGSDFGGGDSSFGGDTGGGFDSSGF